MRATRSFAPSSSGLLWVLVLSVSQLEADISMRSRSQTGSCLNRKESIVGCDLGGDSTRIDRASLFSETPGRLRG